MGGYELAPTRPAKVLPFTVSIRDPPRASDPCGVTAVKEAGRTKIDNCQTIHVLLVAQALAQRRQCGSQ